MRKRLGFKFSAEFELQNFILDSDFAKTCPFHSGKRNAICTFVPLIKKLTQAVTKKILIWEERSNTEEHPKKNAGIKCQEHFRN
jgi:hypothetical protein